MRSLALYNHYFQQTQENKEIVRPLKGEKQKGRGKSKTNMILFTLVDYEITWVGLSTFL
jgi:hypothetical protein